MGVLIGIVAALVLAACYAPALRDCTVSCATPSECASGQVCGKDGLCAAPEVAGRCMSRMVDAGEPVDAAMPPPKTLPLHVQVMGKGSVVVEGQGICSSGEPQRGDCTYDIAPGVVQRVRAQQVELDQVFKDWPSETCHDAAATCAFTMIEPTSIAARFEKR